MKDFFSNHDKGDVLKFLETKLQNVRILPQYKFSIHNYNSLKKQKILSDLKKIGWLNTKLIVRSSSKLENTGTASLAGRYKSKGPVSGRKNILLTIEDVIKSFGREISGARILMQPYLSSVSRVGVATTFDGSSGAPYYVINEMLGSDTFSITGGYSKKNNIYYVNRKRFLVRKNSIRRIISLCRQLENIFQNSSLSLEYAFDKNDNLFLFQVRPLIQKRKNINSRLINSKIARTVSNFSSFQRQKKSKISKTKTILSVMSDWNPAEMIGIKPRPLSVSLYKNLITDKVWAKQRKNYGYSDLTKCPLMKIFGGTPYIDVETSIKSFIPKKITENTKRKLIKFYMEKLDNQPELHDKIEFDIVFTCLTPSVLKKIFKLKNHGFTRNQINEIQSSLLEITKRIIDPERGLWRNDLEKIDQLVKKQEELSISKAGGIKKIQSHLENCRKFGTLPFAGLARCAFIAIQFLNSFIESKTLSRSRVREFLASVNTVAKQLTIDMPKISKKEFISKYGHLRPNSYDILSYSYKEKFKKYFSSPTSPRVEKSKFKLKKIEEERINKCLKKLQLQIKASDFFYFAKHVIEGREYSKFIFSKSLNEILKLIEKFCKNKGLTRKKTSFITIKDLITMKKQDQSTVSTLKNKANLNEKNYFIDRQILSPPVIRNENDFFYFKQPSILPNFISSKNISGEVLYLKLSKMSNKLDNKIIHIENADPGYDWVFSRSILGLVTCYGGPNSHMAVRAAELRIPAVIGVGKELFERMINSQKLTIDCATKKIGFLQ